MSLDSSPAADWRGASWKDAEMDALRLGAAMTTVEKLRWIEEAEAFGLEIQRRRWRAGKGVDPRFLDHLRVEDRKAAGESVPAPVAPPAPFARPAWAALMD